MPAALDPKSSVSTSSTTLAEGLNLLGLILPKAGVHVNYGIHSSVNFVKFTKKVLTLFFLMDILSVCSSCLLNSIMGRLSFDWDCRVFLIKQYRPKSIFPGKNCDFFIFFPIKCLTVSFTL